MRFLTSLGVLALLAACGQKSQGSAPWITMPDLATHSTLYFPVRPGDVHGPAAGEPLTDCNQCHADRSSGVTPPPPASSFKIFTCTGCHVEVRPGVYHDDIAQLATLGAHAGNPAFDASHPLAFDVSCRGCHPSGAAVVDHTAIFPLPHGNAAGTVVAACTDCHLSTVDRTQLGCATCHPHDAAATATAHARVPDFDPTRTTAASAMCLRCHGDGVVPVQVSAHATFPIAAGGAHSGPAGGACVACHPSVRPAPKSFAADFGSPACYGCHVQTTAGFHDDSTAIASFHAAAQVAGFEPTSAACLQCHPDGAGGAPVFHAQLFPIDAASKHAGIACASCHGPVRSDLASLQCASCHADPSRSPAFPTVHDPAGTPTTILRILTAPPAPATCSPAVFAPTSADCLMCHARSTSMAGILASHPAGGSTFGRSQHARAGCLTCHVATTQVTATVAPPASPPSGYPTVDFTQPASASRTSPGCATCHTSGCVTGG